MRKLQKLMIAALAVSLLAACDPYYTGLKKDFVAASLSSKILLNRLAETGFDYSTDTIWIREEEFPPRHLEVFNAYLDMMGEGQAGWPTCQASFNLGTTRNGTFASCAGRIDYSNAELHLWMYWHKEGSVWKLIDIRYERVDLEETTLGP